MKWIKKCCLVLIYIVVLLLMVVLQNYLVMHLDQATWINLITLGIFFIAGVLFYILIKGSLYESKEQTADEIVSKIPTKEEYFKVISQFDLTKREVELGYLIVAGYSNAQIAQDLFIAESTVKKHVTHIYEKTGVLGRKEFKELFEKVR